MKTKSEMPGTLMDFVCTFGVMKGLFYDNAKVHTGAAVKDILQQYNIDDMHSDPLQQNHNPSEILIKEVKATTNMVMDRTGAPPWIWLLFMVFIVYIIKCLEVARLDQRTPTEVYFGITPDIRTLLLFSFWYPVLYLAGNDKPPNIKEKSGRFSEIYKNKGDSLTFCIWTDNTQELILRSFVRSIY